MSHAPEDRPLVTFALFAYNQEKYIREAVEGAFSQTYSPLEIILSDDGSRDRTFEIIEEMARGYRGPHKILTRQNAENSGIFQHFISVLKIAKGAITVVAAGDDTSLPQRTSEIVKALNGNSNCAAACSAVEKIDVESNSLGFYSPPLHERIGFLHGRMDHLLGCSAAYVTKHVTEIPKFFSGAIAEDAFLSHILQLQGFKIFRIEYPLVRYRIADDNLSMIAAAGFGYSSHLIAEYRKKRRLEINHNTYIAIEKCSHLIGADFQEHRIDVKRLQFHVKKVGSMLRVYQPWAIFDPSLWTFAIRDPETLKFILPRLLGPWFSYSLFLIRETIRKFSCSGRKL